jgi:hypothetical protein
MLVNLTLEQRDLLLQLLNAAIEELGPEIHHTMTSTYKEDLREQRRELETLRHFLSGAVMPPTQTGESAAASAESLGAA